MRKKIIGVFSITLVFAISVFMLAACGGTKEQAETWSDWQITVAATCVLSGQEVRTSNKGNTETHTISINTNGHDWSGWLLTIPVRCETDGQIERICLLCDKYEKKVIPAIGHNHEVNHVDATCGEGGYDEHTCVDCESSYIDNESEALGHSFGNWNITIEPTCETDGEQERYCSNCDEIEKDTIFAIGHDYEINKIEATCCEGGYDEHTCVNCEDSYINNETQELGHSFGEWIVTIEPTCENDGEEERACESCGEVEADIIHANGHDYELNHVEAGCENDGYDEYTCLNCSESYIENETTAVGHEFEQWVITKKPTWDKDGLQQRVCMGCGKIETRIIPSYKQQLLDAINNLGKK